MSAQMEPIKKETKDIIIPSNWKDRTQSSQEFREFLEETIKDIQSIQSWWENWANQLPWFKKWEKILDDSNPPFYRWFTGAQTNLSYLCTDWQLSQGRKNKVALIWEGEPVDETKEPNEVKKLTYYELHKESNRIADILKNKLGVKKSNIVTFYLPMIPELLLYMLAVQRIGVAHSIVFSGFGADSLAARILDSKSKIIVTADGMYRRGRILDLKSIVDEAIKICKNEGYDPEKVIVVRRVGNQIPWNPEKDLWHHELLLDVAKNIELEPERMCSEDFSYILYTSGTTGKPKAVQHSVGGYAVHLYTTTKLTFDIKEDDIYWCTADIGWITGHSYTVYGPLMCGATIVMYEGAPDYPDVSRWASIIHRYGVTIFYTVPTALKLLMRFPEETYTKYDLGTIRIMHSVGEPIDPEVWRWFYRVFGRENVVCTSTWWMTETGGIVTGHIPGLSKIYPLKPGTNGFPIPGIKMEILDEEGNLANPGEKNYLVISTPFPGMLMTLYGDPQRYIDEYFGKYKHKGWYYYSGDFALRDEDGYLWVLGRADDVLKVAGHRIGAAEVESAMMKHPAVAEAACVGKSHPIKGEIPLIYVTLKLGYQKGPEMQQELSNHLRSTMGKIVASDAMITFIELLPKTRSGKIMRRLLRAVAEGKALGDLTTLETEAAVQESKKAYELVKATFEKYAS